MSASAQVAAELAVVGSTPRQLRRRRREARQNQESRASEAKGASRWFVLGVLILMSLYAVGPVWWLVVAATKTKEELYRTNGLWFGDFNLFNNVASLFTYQDGIFLRWLGNSALYSVVGSLGHTLVSVAAGYGLAKFTYRGKGLTMGFIIASFLIPATLMTVPSFLLYVRMGIYDTIWAMLIPGLFGAFSVYLAKVYAEGAVPTELMEAARIDGAGEYRIFFSMGLRLMVTPAATIFLLHFVGTWNGFFAPLVFLRDANKWPVMLGLYSWLQRGVDSSVDLTGLVLTGALVATIPMFVLMVSMQRFWRSGVTLGSLK